MIDRELDELLVRALVFDPECGRDGLAEVARQNEPFISAERLAAVVERVWRRARGLGFIEPWLADPTVTEIMVNGTSSLWVERAGRLAPIDPTPSLDDVELLIERILEPLGLRADRLNPLVDARLGDGSRVNIVMPPLVDEPVLTIRRFSVTPVTLAGFGPPEVGRILSACVTRGDNIIVSGGTGAGKTTLLNALGEWCDPSERIVVIEDTAELQLPGEHLIKMEARPANSEGAGRVSIRDLVRNALRMRPDRIVVGEVRGAETFDLMLALNTGHRGTLTTCHANGAHSVLRRLIQLALLARSGLSPSDIHEQLCDAIDVIVQVSRDGADRVVTDIAGVSESGRLQSWWSNGAPAVSRAA